MLLHFLRPQGDRQIRSFSPERAFRFMQQHGLRRIRHRVQPGIPQDGPGKAGAVHIQESPDLPGITERMRTVADDLQHPGGKRRYGRSMGRLCRILRIICSRCFLCRSIRRDGKIDHIGIPGRPRCVLRFLIRFTDQDRSLQRRRKQSEAGTQCPINRITHASSPPAPDSIRTRTSHAPGPPARFPRSKGSGPGRYRSFLRRSPRGSGQNRYRPQ